MATHSYETPLPSPSSQPKRRRLRPEAPVWFPSAYTEQGRDPPLALSKYKTRPWSSMVSGWPCPAREVTTARPQLATSCRPSPSRREDRPGAQYWPPIPPELQQAISEYLEVSDLKSLRAASRGCFAGVFLEARIYSNLVVKNTLLSADRFTAILDTPRLATLIRSVRYLCSWPSVWSVGGPFPPIRDRLRFGLRRALQGISKCPEIRSVTLEFGEIDHAIISRRILPVREAARFREEALHVLISQLEQLYSRNPDRERLSFKLIGLKAFVNSSIRELMSKFLPHVSHYQMSIKSELIQDMPTQWPGYTRLFPVLSDFIPQASTANLTTLKLQADTLWGFVPTVYIPLIHLPKLERLELGNWTLSHQWQLDWLLAHKETLTELTLNRCAVVHNASVGGELDEGGYPRAWESWQDPIREHRMALSWIIVFEEIEKHCARLTKFRFGMSDSDIEHLWRPGFIPGHDVCYNAMPGEQTWTSWDPYPWAGVFGHERPDTKALRLLSATVEKRKRALPIERYKAQLRESGVID